MKNFDGFVETFNRGFWKLKCYEMMTQPNSFRPVLHTTDNGECSRILQNIC